MDRWAYEHGVTLDFSRPGKPTDNAFIESFNGSVRTECLNENWFLSLEDANEKIDRTTTNIDLTALWATWPPKNSLHLARLPLPDEDLILSQRAYQEMGAAQLHTVLDRLVPHYCQSDRNVSLFSDSNHGLLTITSENQPKTE